MELDFCQAVIRHPYCPRHQFSDSFINCYLSYTQLLYRAMKNTVEIGSEGGKCTKGKRSSKKKKNSLEAKNGCFSAKLDSEFRK